MHFLARSYSFSAGLLVISISSTTSSPLSSTLASVAFLTNMDPFLVVNAHGPCINVVPLVHLIDVLLYGHGQKAEVGPVVDEVPVCVDGIPQDGGNGDRSGQVLDYVPIDGEDDLLLSEDSSFISLPPQLPLGGPGDGGRVVAPLDGGHGDRPVPVPDSAASGGKDDPLLSGDSSFLSLPTQLFFRQSWRW